jgi:hypothetical protein
MIMVDRVKDRATVVATVAAGMMTIALLAKATRARAARSALP